MTIAKVRFCNGTVDGVTVKEPMGGNMPVVKTKNDVGDFVET